MESKTVRKLDLGLNHLPMLPDRQMMAKAAAAVYQTAVENHRPRED